jgi:hypothetical protein
MKDEQDGIIRIAVLDRGHVWVGHVAPAPDLAFHWKLSGRCIRRWGTTNGLSQLASGPTESTVLDDPAEILIPFRALLFFLEVDQSAWKSMLSSAPVPKTRQHR